MEDELKELKSTVDDIMQKLNEYEQTIAKMKNDLDESIKFEKDLIGALQDAEKENDVLLLPQGEYHGVKID